MKDYFLSHASEDKKLVRKVYSTLKEKGYTCWFDEAEILPGDSLVDKIFREGLKTSKFVILFLSKKFLSKEWPKAELETIIAKQIRENKKTIIPFLIDISHHELVNQYPYFESIYCGSTNSGFDLMITQLENLLSREIFSDESQTQLPKANSRIHVRTSQETEEFDSEKIIELPALREINRLRETFYITYHRAPNDMQIDIIEFSLGSYHGVCNYAFWGPEQATPYKSMHPQSTITAALNDAIKGIDAFDSADFPNELIFWVSDNDVIFDGNGENISKEEAHSRRSKRPKSYKKIKWTPTTMNGGPWWLISKNFTKKEFSVIGPIDDDTEYIEKCMIFQNNGIDFRLETVPINKDSKENLENYFKEKYSLKLVENTYLYGE